MNSKFIYRIALAVLLLGAAVHARAAKESSILLRFGDNDRHSAWPFTCKMSSVPSSINDAKQQLNVGKIQVFTIKEHNLPVRIWASNAIAPHPSRGLRIGSAAGNYMELPGQEGMEICRIRLRSGDNGNIANPSIKTLSDQTVAGGEAWKGKKTQGEDHEWVLSGLKAGEAVRIVSTVRGFCEMQEVEVFYKPVKVKKPKKGDIYTLEASFTSETNEKGDIIFSLPTMSFTDKTARKEVSVPVGQDKLVLWGEHGVTKATMGGGKKIVGLNINAKGVSKASGKQYGGDPACGWIKAPAIEGKRLVSVDIELASLVPGKGSSGSVSISSAVIGDDQHGSADQAPETSFLYSRRIVMPLENPEAGRAYYITLHQAQNLNVKKLIFNYKK